jgi:hypothetical protein
MLQTWRRLWNERRDALISAAMFVLAFALYVRTLAPSVAFLFDDTLDFQYVIPRLGIVHQTGYPLYTLLGKLFTLLVPLNDPAFRLNLFTALNGALAVAFVYLVVRRLAAHRIAAIIAALTFAVGDTFWAQAVVAEIYTMQMLLAALLLYLTLHYASLVTCHPSASLRTGPSLVTRHTLYVLAFVMGLGLAHHRLIVLLYPAIALYVLLTNRSILKDWKTLARAALFFLLPFAFYLYLPLRGAVGSADGMYQNTPAGFVEWTSASKYFEFIFGNPLNVQRDTAYYATLFQKQFGILGLALAAIGAVWLLRKPREWALLVVALVAVAGFAFNYRVADVEVHFLTTFLLLTVFVGIGADALLGVFSNFLPFDFAQGKPPSSKLDLLPTVYCSLVTVLLLLIPFNLLLANYPTNQLSSKWDVHDYGLDVLNQPLEKNATVVGILGEMTLLRYFQENGGIRPDVQTIAADKEDARLSAIADALKQNRIVYLTRPLKGAPEKYSLASLGPLIRVQPSPVPPVPSHALDEDLGSVKLLGYDLDASRLNAIPGRWHAENGRVLRVTVYWQAAEKVANDAMVSIKVLRKDQRVVGQIDQRPVRDAYPTTAWRVNEVIADTYDVPIFLGVTPSDYTVKVTMYDAASGTVIGQRDLEQIALGPDVTAPRREAWNIAHTMDADFSVLSLVGYSLDTDAPVRPGDVLPLTLLWRGGSNKLPDNLLARMWLDASGKTVASRDTPISIGFPPMLWQPNVYVRDWPQIRVPANVADGRYNVNLAASRNNVLLGSTLLPFHSTVVSLGRIEIKNRQRVMTAPPIARPLEAVFDKKIKLLGYDLAAGEPGAMRLTLHWKSLALMDTSYTVFVHLLDVQNNVVASGDAPPGSGEFPTTGWIENEYIADTHAFALPTDLPAGAYQIEIGLYDPVTGVRLKTLDGQDQVILTEIELVDR